jgi:hypothetical protein
MHSMNAQELTAEQYCHAVKLYNLSYLCCAAVLHADHHAQYETAGTHGNTVFDTVKLCNLSYVCCAVLHADHHAQYERAGAHHSTVGTH